MKLLVALKPGHPTEAQSDTPSTALQDTIASSYLALPATEVDVVMLGDSITHFGMWQELLSDVRVLNRGILGDTSEGVLNRVDEVVRHSPKVVYLMIGINDLANGTTPATVRDNIEETIEKLQRHSIRVVLLDILYTRKPIAYQNFYVPEKVRQCNLLLDHMDCERINLNASLSSGFDLNQECTLDGIHLTGHAYYEFANAIKRSLLQIGNIPSQQ